MIKNYKYTNLLWIMNTISYHITKTSPLNNNVILKNNNPSMTLDKNAINDQSINKKNEAIANVYNVGILIASLPILSFLEIFKKNDYKKYINVFITYAILLTVGLMVFIYGWVTKKYIHNFIIQSWKHWYIYIISLLLIILIPFNVMFGVNHREDKFLSIISIILIIIGLMVLILGVYKTYNFLLIISTILIIAGLIVCGIYYRKASIKIKFNARLQQLGEQNDS